ncbi:hypothetical protein Tco_0840499 [Tanacetum coccineum]|uniref:Uncharacterized protein n=1 Tax=Tanacetum coccineum TaxID=301880 RepID=A0ABQ5AWD8_9ASTR
MASQDARLSKFKADFKQQQSKMTNKFNAVLKAITDRLAGALPNDLVKNPKLSINSTTSVLSARSYPTEEPQCSTHIHGSINAITIHPKQQSDSHDDKPAKSEEEEKDSLENTNTNPSASPDPSVSFIIEKIVKKNDDSLKEEPKAGGLEVEYFDIFPYSKRACISQISHVWPHPLDIPKNPIIMEGCPSDLKIPCNIGHVHVEKAYIDINSPLNLMTRMMYNWIMRRKLNHRENSDR